MEVEVAVVVEDLVRLEGNGAAAAEVRNESRVDRSTEVTSQCPVDGLQGGCCLRNLLFRGEVGCS